MAGCARPVRNLDSSRFNASLAFSLEAYSSFKMSLIIGTSGPAPGRTGGWSWFV
jgi:hypothetical protein